MRKFIIGIIFFIILLGNFIFWDYRSTGNILWGDNIVQTLVFLIVFYVIRWLLDSPKKNKTSNS